MVSFKIEGLEALQRKLAAIPAELHRQERAAMHQAILLLGDEARSRLHSPAGRARRGLDVGVSGSGDTLEGHVRTRSKAARFSQRGRPPGKQPPLRAVRAWLRRSGHYESPAQVFLIARAIGRRGMRGHPVMEATIQARRFQVIQAFKEAVARALKAR